MKDGPRGIPRRTIGYQIESGVQSDREGSATGPSRKSQSPEELRLDELVHSGRNWWTARHPACCSDSFGTTKQTVVPVTFQTETKGKAMSAESSPIAPWAGGTTAVKVSMPLHGTRSGGARQHSLRQSKVYRVVRTLWAGPWSLFGLLIGALGMLSGGQVQRKGRVLEFWGGCLPTILHFFPFYSGSPVATFGQVVLGRSSRYLNACRMHQLVHVRQYERWGLLFVPAYVSCSAAMWFRGKHPYYDNPFERSAFCESRAYPRAGPRE